ncbi:hypothetical protein [Agaribacter marinus]|nr:hypothetical protein [Agaribacter marinus]
MRGIVIEAAKGRLMCDNKVLAISQLDDEAHAIARLTRLKTCLHQIPVGS